MSIRLSEKLAICLFFWQSVHERVMLDLILIQQRPESA